LIHILSNYYNSASSRFRKKKEDKQEEDIPLRVLRLVLLFFSFLSLALAVD